MPSFGKKSKRNLAECHIDLQVLFNYVIRHYDCSVITGHRGEEAQNEAYNNGYSQRMWPNSKHNRYPSHAVDVPPYEKTGIDWDKLQSAHFAGFVMGIAKRLYDEKIITHRIRSGADWDGDNDVNDTTFWDACHFEIIID